MTKQEALQKIEELKEFIRNEDAKPSKEDRLWGLITGLSIKIDWKKYPNSVFLFSGDDVWVEYNVENNYLWLRRSTVWSIFEKEYGLSYNEIQKFIKEQVEKHFKMSGVTPWFDKWLITDRVEKHLKMSGVTPHVLLVLLPSPVEKHFKMSGVTPTIIKMNT